MSFVLPPRWQMSRAYARYSLRLYRVQVKKKKKRRGRRPGARQMSRSIKPTLKTISVYIYTRVPHGMVSSTEHQ